MPVPTRTSRPEGRLLGRGGQLTGMAMAKPSASNVPSPGPSPPATEVQLTNNTVNDLGPNWSPDAQHIVFNRSLGGGRGNQLLVIKPDDIDPDDPTDPDRAGTQITGVRPEDATSGLRREPSGKGGTLAPAPGAKGPATDPGRRLGAMDDARVKTRSVPATRIPRTRRPHLGNATAPAWIAHGGVLHLVAHLASVAARADFRSAPRPRGPIELTVLEDVNGWRQWPRDVW